MSTPGRPRAVSCVLFLLVISAGCAHLRPGVDSARDRDLPPLPLLVQAVQTYKASDPDASFTFFNGHVDSFATTAKPTVPDYARPILESLGLSTAPRVPQKLPAPIASAQTAKPARDLDADLDVALPMLRETEQGVPLASRGDSDDPGRGDGKRPPEDTRRRPAVDPQRLVAWERPSADIVERERRAAQPILQAFLARHRSLFEVAPAEAGTVLRQTQYQAGAYFRKAVFEQFYAGERLLYGRTVVHFDVNWNLIGISRMITTPQKVPVPAMAAGAIDRRAAYNVAAGVFAECGGSRRDRARRAGRGPGTPAAGLGRRAALARRRLPLPGHPRRGGQDPQRERPGRPAVQRRQGQPVGYFPGETSSARSRRCPPACTRGTTGGSSTTSSTS